MKKQKLNESKNDSNINLYVRIIFNILNIIILIWLIWFTYHSEITKFSKLIISVGIFIFFLELTYKDIKSAILFFLKHNPKKEQDNKDAKNK
ncbi:MAG: hypothetical protein QXR30_01215 [Candidatus Woesearchaeota archaeon]